MWTWFHKLASPPHFYSLSAKMIPWFAVPGLALIGYGTWAGLFIAPPDYQQGDAFRIIYVHVPSAYLSLLAYMIMAVSGGIGLIWRMKLAHAVAAAAAPLGAAFTFLALVTGSIWGRPTFWTSRLHCTPTTTCSVLPISWLNTSTISSGEVSSAAPSAGVIDWSEFELS